ncbi:hypothetical protein [Helicobacter pylori]|uniref:hypothetical protein n=1 Tax=Helicobacter pylori TaxID=210 RepID=UPI0018E1FB23|nr:hypothetical protein [Helicobacter pylori]
MLLIYNIAFVYGRSYAFKGMTRKRADALEIKICKIPIIGIQSETQTLAPA